MHIHLKHQSPKLLLISSLPLLIWISEYIVRRVVTVVDNGQAGDHFVKSQGFSSIVLEVYGNYGYFLATVISLHLGIALLSPVKNIVGMHMNRKRSQVFLLESRNQPLEDSHPSADYDERINEEPLSTSLKQIVFKIVELIAQYSLIYCLWITLSVIATPYLYASSVSSHQEHTEIPSTVYMGEERIDLLKGLYRDFELSSISSKIYENSRMLAETDSADIMNIIASVPVLEPQYIIITGDRELLVLTLTAGLFTGEGVKVDLSDITSPVIVQNSTVQFNFTGISNPTVMPSYSKTSNFIIQDQDTYAYYLFNALDPESRIELELPDDPTDNTELIQYAFSPDSESLFYGIKTLYRLNLSSLETETIWPGTQLLTIKSLAVSSNSSIVFFTVSDDLALFSNLYIISITDITEPNIIFHDLIISLVYSLNVSPDEEFLYISIKFFLEPKILNITDLTSPVYCFAPIKMDSSDTYIMANEAKLSPDGGILVIPNAQGSPDYSSAVIDLSNKVNPALYVSNALSRTDTVVFLPNSRFAIIDSNVGPRIVRLLREHTATRSMFFYTIKLEYLFHYQPERSCFKKYGLIPIS